MHKGLSVVMIGTLLCGISGCAPQGASEATAPNPSQVKPLPTEGNMSNEVVIRLCPGVSGDEFEAVLVSHRLELKKRSSPTIATLSWQDGRQVETVVAQLLAEKTVICAAQPNYQYKTLPK